MYDIKALYEATSVAHACQLRIEHPEAQILLDADLSFGSLEIKYI